MKRKSLKESETIEEFESNDRDDALHLLFRGVGSEAIFKVIDKKDTFIYTILGTIVPTAHQNRVIKNNMNYGLIVKDRVNNECTAQISWKYLTSVKLEKDGYATYRFETKETYVWVTHKVK